MSAHVSFCRSCRQVIYCTARTHTALDKALETIGMGMAKLHEVPHDDQQRMIPEKLEKAIQHHKKVYFTIRV